MRHPRLTVKGRRADQRPTIPPFLSELLNGREKLFGLYVIYAPSGGTAIQRQDQETVRNARPGFEAPDSGLITLVLKRLFC